MSTRLSSWFAAAMLMLLKTTILIFIYLLGHIAFAVHKREWEKTQFRTLITREWHWGSARESIRDGKTENCFVFKQNHSKGNTMLRDSIKESHHQCHQVFCKFMLLHSTNDVVKLLKFNFRSVAFNYENRKNTTNCVENWKWIFLIVAVSSYCCTWCSLAWELRWC